MAKSVKIKDLHKDSRNANKGTERGNELLENSFKKHGAGRSILADKNLTIIAGNHALDSAKAAGIEEVIVVPTNGKQLVVVQRTDLDIDSKEGRELALADNATAKANINFDIDVVQELAGEFDIDLGEIGIEVNVGGGPTFNDDYDEDDAAEAMETDSSSNNENAENLFPLAVALTKAQKLNWDKTRKAAGFKSDTEFALSLLHYAKHTDIEYTTYLDNQKSK